MWTGPFAYGRADVTSVLLKFFSIVLSVFCICFFLSSVNVTFHNLQKYVFIFNCARIRMGNVTSKYYYRLLFLENLQLLVAIEIYVTFAKENDKLQLHNGKY